MGLFDARKNASELPPDCELIAQLVNVVEEQAVAISRHRNTRRGVITDLRARGQGW